MRSIWSFLGAGVISACLFPFCAVSAAELVAHWHFNESGPPYADAGLLAVPMTNDPLTTPAIAQPGIEGFSALTHVDSPPVATRLTANDPSLQRDSFGFSFWINPVSANPFDNLMAKEMVFDNGIPNDERMSWQVHLLGDNGAGFSPVELVVRGDDRLAGNFYGAVSSSSVVPLYTNASDWIHIAGGYDAVSGELSLFVNGVETVTPGAPGASSSGGGALAVGTAKNGADIVSFAASVAIEDLQLYDGPLWLEEVVTLMDDPGIGLAPAFYVGTVLSASPGGEYTIGFNTTCGASYLIEAAADMNAFLQVASYESSVNLVHDGDTAGPWLVAGKEGDSALMRWENPPGISTRLVANNPVLQKNTFGFSLWFRPSNMNPWDNLIAKEMAFDDSVPDWSRMAWQLHLLGDNGSGEAPLELVVRGSDRTVTDFYGAVQSTAVLPLYGDAPSWVHVAGGYDAATGELTLYVDGNLASSVGVPGADNSDGSPFVAGTVRNGNDFVQFSTVARLDDIQLYDRPLSASQVASLMSWPGLAAEYSPKLLARWQINEPSPPYLDSAQSPCEGEVAFSEASLASALGVGAITNVFFRVYEAPAFEDFGACE